MRGIQTGCIVAALGFAAVGHAQEATWRTGAGNPLAQPAVTLGPPTVSLGAPRPMASSVGRADVAPCAYGVVARGAMDDKGPMPPGPVLPAAPMNPAPTPLTAPTPLAPSTPAPATLFGGPVTSAPVTGGPVISSDLPMNGPVYSGPMPGASCATCAADPSWAPLPGGAFAPECHPCGCIFYGEAEALLWWVKNGTLPPLLTVSPPGFSGVVAPGTRVVFGDEAVAPQERIGGRFTVGMWFNECQNWGVIGSYFFLSQRGINYSAAGDGTMVLARPFFNINPVVGGSPMNPVADREIIASPGLANGTFTANTSNNLWGADLNARTNIFTCCQGRLDGLIGFRYLRFDESLNIGETFAGIAGQNAGRSGSLMDTFQANNDFYGGQLGLMGELKRGCWTLDVTGKVALGTTRQSVNAMGGQMGINETGAMVTGPGLLVQPSNSGSRTRDVFSVVPEVNINLGFQLTQHMKIFAGYDFLYWSNMLRVGDQVDTTLDVNSRTFPISQPAGATRPAVQFKDTGFWAQGFNVGLEFKW